SLQPHHSGPVWRRNRGRKRTVALGIAGGAGGGYSRYPAARRSRAGVAVVGRRATGVGNDGCRGQRYLALARSGSSVARTDAPSASRDSSSSGDDAMNIEPILNLLGQRLGKNPETLATTAVRLVVEGRLRRLNMDSPAAYATRLATDTTEWQALIDEV